MKMVLARDTRVWMLCAVALLWAWGEAAADDPESATVDVAARGAKPVEPAADLSHLWSPAAGPAAGVHGSR